MRRAIERASACTEDWVLILQDDAEPMDSLDLKLKELFRRIPDGAACIMLHHGKRGMEERDGWMRVTGDVRSMTAFALRPSFAPVMSQALRHWGGEADRIWERLVRNGGVHSFRGTHARFMQPERERHYRRHSRIEEVLGMSTPIPGLEVCSSNNACVGGVSPHISMFPARLLSVFRVGRIVPIVPAWLPAPCRALPGRRREDQQDGERFQPAELVHAPQDGHGGSDDRLAVVVHAHCGGLETLLCEGEADIAERRWPARPHRQMPVHV